VLVHGSPVADDLVAARTAVGMVFQDPRDGFVAATVRADVAFGPENLGLARDEIDRRVTDALEDTMREDAAAGRPMIAALACARGGDLPGRGFFDLAAQLGVPVTQDSTAIAAYRAQVMAAHQGQAA